MVSWKQKVVKYICEDIPPICLSVLMLSCVWFFTTPWTVACQAPLPMGFSQQEYCSGLPFPSPRDLPNPGMKPSLLHWQADSLPLSHWGSPRLSKSYIDSFFTFHLYMLIDLFFSFWRLKTFEFGIPVVLSQCLWNQNQPKQPHNYLKDRNQSVDWSLSRA